MFLRRNLMGIALLFAIGTMASANTITIGTSNSGNSFPFISDTYTGEYQQVYSASLFSGPKKQVIS
jgi:hypothetical protein